MNLVVCVQLSRVEVRCLGCWLWEGSVGLSGGAGEDKGRCMKCRTNLGNQFAVGLTPWNRPWTLSCEQMRTSWASERFYLVGHDDIGVNGQRLQQLFEGSYLSLQGLDLGALVV